MNFTIMAKFMAWLLIHYSYNIALSDTKETEAQSSQIVDTIAVTTVPFEPCPTILANKGYVISSDPSKKCFISLGSSIEVHLFYGTFKERFYGPFNWTCMEVCKGTSFSHFEGCDNCLICSHNEMIKGCESKLFTIAIGISSSFILIFVILIVLRWFYLVFSWYQITTHLSYYYNLVLHKRRKARHEERTAKLLNLLDIPISKTLEERKQELELLEATNISFDGITSCEEYQAAVNRKLDRIHVLKTLIHTEEVNKIKLKTNDLPPPVREVKKRKAFSLFCFIHILFCLSPSPAESCDTTLFMKSSHQICEDVNCDKVHSNLLQLHSNSKVCLVGEHGFWLNIQSQNIVYLDHFSPMYMTSDFNLESYSHRDCESSGDCSFASSNKMSDPKWLPENIRESFNKSGICSRHICSNTIDRIVKTSSTNCGSCFYDDECIFAAGRLFSVGETFIISKFSERTWYMRVVISSSNFTQTTILEPKMPINLKEITFTVLADTGSFYAVSSHLLTNDNYTYGYPVMASDINLPVWGQIGDFQIDLRRTKAIHGFEPFTVSSLYCKDDFHLIKSSLQNFRLRQKNLKPFQVRYKNGEIIIKREEKGSVTLGLTLKEEINSLTITRPICELTIIDTMCCTSCNSPSYVIFKARGIKSEGRIKVESNCSLNWNFLQCEEGEQDLLVEGSPDRCNFYFDELKNNVTVGMNCLFKGALNDIGYVSIIHSDDPGDFFSAAGRVLNNESFLTSFQFTFIGVSTLMIFCRVVVYIVATKTSKAINHLVEVPSAPANRGATECSPA